MREGRAGIVRGPVPPLLILLLALLLEPSRPGATGGFASPLEQRLQDLAADAPRDAVALEALQTFYAGRAHRPLWLDHDGPNRRAHALAIELRSAERHGLRPEDYLEPLREVAAADLAAVEVALSRTLIRYATDIAVGRVDPRVVDAEIEVAPAPFDPLGLLEKIAGGTPVATAVGALATAHPGYERLREALVRLRTGPAGVPWPRLPPGGTLEVGLEGPEIRTLRRMLELTGDLEREPPPDAPPADAPEVFDPALAEAVARFQHRHGLAPDGRVGARTRAALAITPAQRIDQITLNLERLRWLNGDLGERHIFVNLADFNLRMVERGVPIFQTRVVVGAPYHRTPVFTGQMTYIEINPYWHVPPSIARDEILPAVAQDPTYLIEHDMEVLDDWSHEARLLDPSTVDWRAIPPDQLRFKFRQRPGP
ncbi:MAG TPA: L,D-transpeptidase family protein, partial [Geminicoccaceae bacterium]